ncbi:MAG TPA: carboxymuconolactone decarboxylase family protein [Chloroflexia bacterium]|nr:carboxymuconolactone decarboxylase family protein [Chloroflexia bacterium]
MTLDNATTNVLHTTSSAQAVFNSIEQELGAGMVPRLFLLLENQPVLLEHLWGEFRTLILQGQLPRSLKEMVGLVVALTTHCDYVQVVHMHSLSLQGVTREALQAIKMEDFSSSNLNSLSQKALRFAALAVATRTASAASTEEWMELRNKTSQVLENSGFSPQEKFELIGTVALFEQICSVANLLQLDPSQP